MKTRVFYSHQFAGIRRGMNDIGAMITTSHFPYEIEFVGDSTTELREYAEALAKSNGAEVEIKANVTGSSLSDYSFRPKPRNVKIQPISGTAKFLTLALPDHSHREDVTAMYDLWESYDNAVRRYGTLDNPHGILGDPHIQKARTKAQRAENSLLLEALQAALASGRLLWKGEESI